MESGQTQARPLVAVQETCALCGDLNCLTFPCTGQPFDSQHLPLIDRRHHGMALDYPANRMWVYDEFEASHREAVAAWHYAERFEDEGNRIQCLSPSLQAAARKHGASQAPVDPVNRRIHFGFDNMWYSREPVYLVTREGEAKIWWQPKDVDPEAVRPPERCVFLRDAISPALFLERLVLLFGMPPRTWPLREEQDGETTWGAMLTRKNGDQVFFRVWAGRPQIAYNGTLNGMYATVGLVQLLLGPPGAELYREKR